MEGKELRLSVRVVLDGMHPRFRTILALRDLHGISCREIGPILGLTYATVRWRLHKARQLFRERWEREGDMVADTPSGEILSGEMLSSDNAPLEAASSDAAPPDSKES